MNTHRNLTHELQTITTKPKAKSWKHKQKIKKNEKHTKFEQKKQCEGTKSEKLDNDKLWNYKACSPFLQWEAISSIPLTSNS
jgi:hypothetical protein